VLDGADVLRRDAATGVSLEAVLASGLKHPSVVATHAWAVVTGKVRVPGARGTGGGDLIRCGQPCMCAPHQGGGAVVCLGGRGCSVLCVSCGVFLCIIFRWGSWRVQPGSTAGEWAQGPGCCGNTSVGGGDWQGMVLWCGWVVDWEWGGLEGWKRNRGVRSDVWLCFGNVRGSSAGSIVWGGGSTAGEWAEAFQCCCHTRVRYCDWQCRFGSIKEGGGALWWPDMCERR
jgi:hypothetical protein